MKPGSKTRNPWMTGLRRAAAGLAVGVAVTTTGNLAEATVVERVVAVVSERSILLSDLRRRARPLLVRIYQSVPKGASRSAATSQMYKELLERMVDEELERRAANKAHITVSAKEIDAALERIAKQNEVSVEKLIQEAVSTGLTRLQYRQEVRRQLLEAKLLNLRVAGRIRIGEDDLRTAYRRFVLKERQRLSFRLAWIKIPAPRKQSAKSAKKARTLAKRIARRAAAGEDFGRLAKRYSSDSRTRRAGGLLPAMRPGKLPRSLDQAALNLESGQVSGAIRRGNEWVILKLVEREQSELPTYQEARSQLKQRVYMDKMSEGRTRWLKQLRKQNHVDVRM